MSGTPEKGYFIGVMQENHHTKYESLTHYHTIPHFDTYV